MQGEGLVRFVDRPCAKAGAEARCRGSKFLCRWLTGGFEFGTVRTPSHDSVSPTGIEDEEAFRIGRSGCCDPTHAAFRVALAETGYVEGRNVALEFRSAEGQIDRLPALASDLVRRKVAMII